MKDVAKKTKYDIPTELAGFFARPPMRIYEDRPVYEQVRKGVIETIEPRNKFEWLLVLDIANLTWDIRGFGKDKAAIVNTTWKEALRMILESLLDGDPQERRSVAQARAEKYFTEEGRNWVIEFLGKHGLREDSIGAQAAALRLPELDIIDRQMGRARVMRMAMTRDIMHHRIAGSWREPDEVLRIVDANASLVPPDSPADQDAPVP
jgi:hypothetical protein